MGPDWEPLQPCALMLHAEAKEEVRQKKRRLKLVKNDKSKIQWLDKSKIQWPVWEEPW